MLGIGQITTRIAELIRGAMPFAIVNNGTASDGTSRPMSQFANIISYPTVQQAIDAGHKRIEVAKGLYPGFTMDVNGITITGANLDETLIDGTTIGHAITINCNDFIISDMKVQTTGGAGNDYDAIVVGTSGIPSGGVIERVQIGDSDAFGIRIEHGSGVRVAHCWITGCDSSGYKSMASSGSSNGNSIINCICSSNGGQGIEFYNGTVNFVIGNNLIGNTGNGIYCASTGDVTTIVANQLIDNGSYQIRLESGSNYNCVVGNTTSGTGGVSDGGGTSTVANNESW